MKQKIINPLTYLLPGNWEKKPPSNFRAGHLILALEMPPILQENALKPANCVTGRYAKKSVWGAEVWILPVADGMLPAPALTVINKRQHSFLIGRLLPQAPPPT